MGRDSGHIIIWQGYEVGYDKLHLIRGHSCPFLQSGITRGMSSTDMEWGVLKGGIRCWYCSHATAANVRTEIEKLSLGLADYTLEVQAK
jgi:hypothetical protein